MLRSGRNAKSRGEDNDCSPQIAPPSEINRTRKGSRKDQPQVIPSAVAPPRVAAATSATRKCNQQDGQLMEEEKKRLPFAEDSEEACLQTQQCEDEVSRWFGRRVFPVRTPLQNSDKWPPQEKEQLPYISSEENCFRTHDGGDDDEDASSWLERMFLPETTTTLSKVERIYLQHDEQLMQKKQLAGADDPEEINFQKQQDNDVVAREFEGIVPSDTGVPRSAKDSVAGAYICQKEEEIQLVQQKKKLADTDARGNYFQTQKADDIASSLFEEMKFPDTVACAQLDRDDEDDVKFTKKKIKTDASSSSGRSSAYSPNTIVQMPPTSDDSAAEPLHRLTVQDHILPPPGAVAVPGIGAPGHASADGSTEETPTEESQSRVEPPLLNAELVRHDTCIVEATAVPKKEWWRQRIAFLVFSAIVLGSAVRYDDVLFWWDGDYHTTNKSAQMWTIILSSISLGLELIIIVMYLATPLMALNFARKRVEGTLYIALAGLWTAIVAIVNNNDMAVAQWDMIWNANLYYFSWAGFFCSLVFAATYLNGVCKVDGVRGKRFSLWSATFISSLIVMGVCVNIFRFEDDYAGRLCNVADDDDLTRLCRKVIFGIALGASAAVLSLLMMGMKVATSTIPLVLESGISVVLTVMYSCGAGFLTSIGSPAEYIGNLYYFTWISLLLAVMVGGSCFEEYLDKRKSNSGGNASEERNQGM